MGRPYDPINSGTFTSKKARAADVAGTGTTAEVKSEQCGDTDYHHRLTSNLLSGHGELSKASFSLSNEACSSSPQEKGLFFFHFDFVETEVAFWWLGCQPVLANTIEGPSKFKEMVFKGKESGTIRSSR
jgi:hypothetical protein